MKIARVLSLLFFFISLAWHAQSQTLDNSGNSLLNGTDYFRQVIYAFDNNGNFVDAVALYGNITFDGNGNYTVNGSVCDATAGCTTTAAALSRTGTYSIGASGRGYINSPYVSGDRVYGLVSKGIFIGSATETTKLYNDFFVAAPVGSTPATNSTFQGNYWISYTDPTAPVSALFQANPDGQGNLGTINASGYFEPGFNSSGTVAFSPLSQTLTSVRYAFSNGAANVTLGGNGQVLLPTSVILYISPDGNFVFGGTYNGFDFFVGVRAGTGTPTFNGLYYQAGLDSDLASFDTYYGSLSAYSSGTILNHQRLSLFGDYTFDDFYHFNGDGTIDDQFLSQHYIFGAGGAIRIGYGQSYNGQPPLLGINVALQAPPFSGSGVYLNPTGVLNSASSSPFTAFLSPGEFISLYGSGLASGNAKAATLPLQTSLGGVQVMINGRAAPLNFVSSTQINAIVPYFTESVAQIQVINNGQPSNTVTALMNLTSPGIFTYNPADGTGYADALHANCSNNCVVSPSNPAQPGETIEVFVEGLGSVTPSVPDGSPGSSTSPLNTTNNTIGADIDGAIQANVGFAGLAPGFAGVYQLNIAIPTGLTAGDHDLNIGGPDSYTSQALISVGSGAATSVAGPTAQIAAPSRQDRRAMPAARGRRHNNGGQFSRFSSLTSTQ